MFGGLSTKDLDVFPGRTSVKHRSYSIRKAT